MGAPIAHPVVPAIADCAKEERTKFAAVRASLKTRFGSEIFDSWFRSLELTGFVGDAARLSVATKFLKSWLQAHYAEPLILAVRVEWPNATKVEIEVRTAGRAVALHPAASVFIETKPIDVRLVGEAPVDATTAEESLIGSSLDRRMVFQNFHVGPSNQLAYGAAKGVGAAAKDSAVVCNPLYIHAAVGLGKTHLIQAVAQEAEKRGRRALYLTAEKFMYGFAQALREATPMAFRECLKRIDLLVIDDTQFLQGKAVARGFSDTVNALLDARKQIVLAADRPAHELEGLDDRTRSRLSGGLSVAIAGLDAGLRVKLLGARIAALRQIYPAFEVPVEVIEYVADAVLTNGRDLDGAVNRLMAHATLTQAPLTLLDAEAAIRDLVCIPTPRHVPIEEIQRAVSLHYNVTRQDVLSSRRTAIVVRPRQVAMYLSKALTLRSLPEIGRRFGGRDHTTVLHAVRKIEGLIGSDKAIADDVTLLRRMLEDRP